jgi:hypothetical protein
MHPCLTKTSDGIVPGGGLLCAGSVVDRAAGSGPGVRRVRLEVVHVARLSLDALEPAADGRRHVVSGLVGHVHVAVQGDVGDRVGRPGGEVARGEVVRQQREDLLLPALPPRQRLVVVRPEAAVWRRKRSPATAGITSVCSKTSQR